MLTRIQHWDTRALDQFLRSRASIPFAWGTNDCALFAADAIQAMTGVDIADDFRDKYADEASAFALIKTVTAESTVADAVAHCATKHGLTEWAHPLLAQRGDLVVVQNGTNLIAGIVHLNGKHVISMAESGPVRLPITATVRAWHV